MGRHLVRRLCAEGWHVRAVDLRVPRSVEGGNGDGWVDECADGVGRVEHFAADVRDQPTVGRCLLGADTLFHLASAHLERGAPAEWYTSVNVDAVRSLVRVARDAGVRRVVHTSSVGIYGHVENPPAAEDSPVHPTNEYGRTKLLGERAALEEAERTGASVVVLRPSWVYGPGCPRTERLLRTIRRRRFFFVGRGENLRHPVFIDEAVEAYLIAADAPDEAMGRPYLIVGPRAVSTRELVETCARALNVPPPRLTLPRATVWTLAAGVEAVSRIVGRNPPVSRRSLDFFEQDNAFSGDRAARWLGFRAVVDLEEGIRRVVSSPE